MVVLEMSIKMEATDVVLEIKEALVDSVVDVVDSKIVEEDFVVVKMED